MKKESRKRLPTKLLALLLTALLFIGALPVNAMAQEAGE